MALLAKDCCVETNLPGSKLNSVNPLARWRPSPRPRQSYSYTHFIKLSGSWIPCCWKHGHGSHLNSATISLKASFLSSISSVQACLSWFSERPLSLRLKRQHAGGFSSWDVLAQNDGFGLSKRNPGKGPKVPHPWKKDSWIQLFPLQRLHQILSFKTPWGPDQRRAGFCWSYLQLLHLHEFFCLQPPAASWKLPLIWSRYPSLWAAKIATTKSTLTLMLFDSSLHS